MKTFWRHICAFILIILLGIKAFAPELANNMEMQLMNVLDESGERRAALEAMGSRLVESGVTEELKAALVYLGSLIEKSNDGVAKKAISEDVGVTVTPEASPVPFNGS